MTTIVKFPDEGARELEQNVAVLERELRRRGIPQRIQRDAIAWFRVEWERCAMPNFKLELQFPTSLTESEIADTTAAIFAACDRFIDGAKRARDRAIISAFWIRLTSST